MTYRRIELSLASEARGELDELCDALELLDYRTWPANDGEYHLTSILVRDDAAEPTIEKIQERFGDMEGFRLTVVALAAVIPRPDDEENEKDSNRSEDTDDLDDDEVRARGRISREELLEDLEGGTQVSRVYLLTVLLSSVIASVGLVRNNAAVVIGAMVIAPLLLPNMSLALGTTLGDFKMVLRSLWTNAAGVALCLGFAVAVGLWVPFDPTVPEIASRTEVGISDVVLALAAGTAGAVAVTSGVSANLIGVMVAVALLPPMVAFGLLIGAEMWSRAGGTGLLLAVNLTCVNLAAVATFLMRGIRPVFRDRDHAKWATAGAIVFWLLLLCGAVTLIWLADAKG
ncbi:MAG: TIGR00341 family protein [Planctomycetota bacterium]